MNKVYEEYFTKDEREQLKASDIRKMQEKEKAIVAVLMTTVLFAFLMFVLLVATFLWFNKLTIFLSTIMSVPTLGILWLLYRGLKSHKELANEIKIRISQEKQTL